MNHSDAAKKIDDALERGHHEALSTSWRQGTIATILDELFPVPEDLEAAISNAFREYYGHIDPIADNQRKSVLACIALHVALFYQNLEVPVDLEAAVRDALSRHGSIILTKGYREEICKDIVSAVARLLRDRDNKIAVLEAEVDDWESSNHERVIADQKKRIEELERRLASARIGVDDTLKFLSRMRNLDKNNIRNCLVGIQRHIAEESPDERASGRRPVQGVTIDHKRARELYENMKSRNKQSNRETDATLEKLHKDSKVDPKLLDEPADI